ncbi:cutinase g-box binding protein [Ophiostoma piceae UAMH 11346]|uniref:C2H2-type transcription factor MSN2 n=1 Tax=Ophiostoma piceae (strain UAMH 11346) TaxID=1262450 RepID=S3CVP9_OPHP1|nr:cutinase g-box binding protein [Ophiostoma piceae UAMH 11346]
MDSVMPMAPAGSYFFYHPEQTTDARRHGNFVPQQMHIQQQQQQQAGPANYYYAMPLTPAYSRPSSSSSQHHQQPVLMSQQKQSPFPGSAMHYMLPATPRSVSVASNGKPTIMLETDFAVDVQPATPTLSSSTSTASSTIGSPSANDTVLPTSMNPMFSCFDNSKDVAGDAMIEHYNAALACNSPPYTPVFIQTPSQSAQPAQTCGRATPTALSSDLLTVSACPSLSSSPAPFAEQDNDFCDPRNLTFCGSEGSVSPTFSTVQVSAASPVADAEEDFTLSSESAIAPSTETIIAAPAPINEFVAHGLPILEEFPELEGDDEFVNLVNLGAEFSHSSIATTPELSNRSRASSSVTTHSEPLEFFESWESSFESNVCEQQPSKRQRTSSGSFPIMNATSSFEVADASASAAGSPEQASETHNTSSNNNDSAMMSSSDEGSASPEADSCNMDGNGTSAPMPTNRRGRKQSLTEDPSKIFACDLCNRRFRRQEHLKRHYRSLHTQDKPFNCHECGKKFSRSDNLAQHARTHGAGALVMNVFDDPDLVAAANGGFMPHMMYQGQGMTMNEDYANMGPLYYSS